MNDAVIYPLPQICPVPGTCRDGALEFISDPFAAAIDNEIDFGARMGPKK